MTHKKTLVRIAGLACAAWLMGVLAMSSPASAQAADPYANPLSLEDPVMCEGQFFGRVSGGSGPYTLAHQLSAQAQTTISLTPFMVSDPGFFQSPPGHLAGVPDGSYSVRVTATDQTGQVVIKSFNAALNQPCASATVALQTTPSPVSVPATALPPALAVTGSDLDTPVLIGFLLVGLGGLALLEARNRQRRSSATL